MVRSSEGALLAKSLWISIFLAVHSSTPAPTINRLHKLPDEKNGKSIVRRAHRRTHLIDWSGVIVSDPSPVGIDHSTDYECEVITSPTIAREKPIKYSGVRFLITKLAQRLRPF
ncbi:MAG: hypothetical protein ABF384_07320 [Verrucomicrobiales bacterium]